MFKKIALATALIASASFATWDKFPVLDANKGQAKVGVGYDMQGDYSALGFYAGARYSVIQNLELGLVLPYTIFTDYDGNDGPDGLGNLPIMVRYQFMQPMNAFVDVTLPIGEEELNGDGIGIHAGVQYAMDINQMISLGSEVGFNFETEGDDKYTPAYEINAGVELDFAVMPQLTPYVGLDLNFKVTDSEAGDWDLGDSGDMGIWLTLGAGYAINEMIGVDASFGMGFGEDYYGEDTPMAIDVNVKINF